MSMYLKNGKKTADNPIRKLKQEVSRKASMANKRLVRLEKNNLTNLPAYQQWLDYKGGVKFSVAGKDYNELQQELARVNRFIESKTSLVRESNKLLKNIADKTGITWDKIGELPDKTKTFFELASKVEQYLRNVEGSASAIGYHKIWSVINEYVEDEQIDLSQSVDDIDSILTDLIEATSYEKLDFKGGGEYQVSSWDWRQWNWKKV